MSSACNVPPDGWACTRVAGHEGPCAAIPKPVAPDWSGHGKYSISFVFADGQLVIKLAGHGDSDGSGYFSFKEEDLECETDAETGVDYRIANLPHSELIEIRDCLNRYFPPSVEQPA